MKRANFWIRFLSSFVDLLTGLVLGLMMSHSIGYFFARRAEVMLMIGSPDSLWKGPIPFLLGVIGPFSYVLPLAIWLVLLSEPLFGTSPGKFLFRLKICKTDGKQAKLKEKWIRHASKTSPLWILILALLVGSWQVAVISVFALVVILPGFFLLLGPQKMAIHDSLSKTGVFWIGARV